MSSGALEVFYIGPDSNLYHNYQDPNGTSGWHGQLSLGGTATSLVAAKNADGRLEIFYIGPDGNIYHNYQTAPGSDNWSGGSALGGAATSLVVANNADGHLEIFYIGPDGNLYHNSQAPNFQSPIGLEGWNGPSALGGAAKGGLVVANNADGRLEIFYIGPDGNIYHNYQTAPNGTVWTKGSPIGGAMNAATSLVVARNA